ncbi:TPA: hypothetical protein ACOJP0_004946 [Vibrio harveyi]|uniref:hypothetical protein n=1 Tax=Vibrio harveyi TaxID=669 RepID=UPI003908E36D
MIKITDELNSVLEELDSGKAIDPEAPMSSLANWTEKFSEAFKLDDDFIEQAEPILAEMFSSPEALMTVFISSFEQVTSTIQEKYKDNEEFLSLLKLIESVDSAQADMGLKLIENSGVLKTQDSVLESSSLVSQLAGIDGEKLAKKLITITPTLIEDCYKRYLSFLVSCKYVLDGSSKLPADKLGVMQQQAASLQNDYPLLIHPDIAWIRNSLAHKNWKYDAKINKVTLVDNKGNEHIFSPEELVVEVLKPFNLSSQIFMDVAHFYKGKKALGALKKL